MGEMEIPRERGGREPPGWTDKPKRRLPRGHCDQIQPRANSYTDSSSRTIRLVNSEIVGGYLESCFGRVVWREVD